MYRSDEIRHRSCHIWIASTIDYRIVVQYWLKHARAVKLSTDNLHRLGTLDRIVNRLPAQIEIVV